MTKVKGEQCIWKSEYGYYVNVTAGGEQLHTFFAASKYGGWIGALTAARRDRDMKMRIQTTFKDVNRWANL